MKYIALIVFLMPLIFSCSKYPESLDESLKIAGKNKIELKKVLDYYSCNPEDSLKYKAACFLIENMKWHFGGQVAPSPMLWELFLVEDSLVIPIMQNPEYWKNEKALYGYKYGAKKMLVKSAINKSVLKKGYQSDLNFLNANFLIETIDVAFKVKELDWCKHLSFNDFCEFILPYRFNTEPVFPLRQKLYKKFSNLYYTDSLQRNTYKTISWLNKYLNRFVWDYDEHPKITDLGFYNIFYWQSKNMFCSHQAVILGQIMRSIGLPVTEVFTPKWRDTDLGHSWCAIPEQNGGLTLFSAFYQNPGEVYAPHSPAHATKLYIKTFAQQPATPFLLKAPGELLPPAFGTPCIKDVTGQFVPVRDIELNLTATKPGNNLCWFSIFIKGNWVPIGWGTLNKERNRAQFKNIPVGLTGMACFFENNKTTPCSKLVTVTSAGFEPVFHNNEKSDLSLTRKFPEKLRLQYFIGDIIGTKIQGANKPDFSDSVTLHTIADTLRPYLQDISFANSGNYRYYRLYAPSWSLHIAEIEFITAKNLPGTVAATQLPVFKANGHGQKKYYKFVGQIVADNPDSTAFDGDMLTYNSKKWVGLNFGQPQQINRVRIAPRNAHNGIVTNNNYRLYYWADKWVSAGVKKAKYNFIEFKDVPANTLYWLRNLDHGTEEQPFFYKNGKQLFSNQQPTKRTSFY